MLGQRNHRQVTNVFQFNQTHHRRRAHRPTIGDMAVNQARVLLIGAGLAILLAGCAPSDPTPQASSPQTSSPQAEPSASPSRTPTPAPAPATVADLVIAPEGLSPILLGDAPEASGLMSYDPAWCTPAEDPGMYGYAPGEPAAGRWYQSFDPSPDTRLAFGIGVNDGTISYFDIRSESLRTAKGIGVGSTLEELTAAYPDLKSQPPGALSTIFYITNDTGRISFEVASVYELAGTVVIVTIHPSSDGPISPWYATDAGAQSCL